MPGRTSVGSFQHLLRLRGPSSTVRSGRGAIDFLILAAGRATTATPGMLFQMERGQRIFLPRRKPTCSRIAKMQGFFLY